MATAAYIEAAGQSNRQPTIEMTLEVPGAASTEYTTYADWFGSVTKTRVDIEEYPGSVLNQHTKTYSNGSAASVLYDKITSAADVDLLVEDISSVNVLIKFTFDTDSGSVGPNVTTYDMQHRLKFDIGGVFSYSDTISETGLVADDTSLVSGNTLQSTDQLIRSYNIPSRIDVAAVYSVDVYFDVVSISNVVNLGDITSVAVTAEEISDNTTTSIAIAKNASDCIIQTSTMDFGSVPSFDPILSIDDIAGSGSASAYSVLGGNTDPPTNDLGSKSDGDTLTAYRYYRVSCAFSTTTGSRVTLYSLDIVSGDYKSYGTHQDIPKVGVKPYVISGSLSPISQKIDLEKGISTTGQTAIKLQWTKEISDLISTGYLKGKDVSIRSGFVGLPSADYNPEITGTWFDHILDPVNNSITVIVQDVSKQFEKRKIPIENYNASGVKTSSPIIYTNENIVDTIINIYDLLGIRGRYIKTADYTALSSGDLSGTDWDVTRTITKPTDAYKLLSELAQTAGLFLVPQGDGTISPILFDDTATPTVEIDCDFCKASAAKGNQDKLTTRSYHYYNVTSGVTEPSDSVDDYDNGYVLIDATAEIAYDPEQGQREWYDKWSIGRISSPLTTAPTALSNMATRWNGWFTYPRLTLDLSDIAPRFANVSVGSVVGITNYILPVPSDEWDNAVAYIAGDRIVYAGRVYVSILAGTNKQPDIETTYWEDDNIVTQSGDYLGRGKTDNKPFLVTGRTYDANTASLKLSILEMP